MVPRPPHHRPANANEVSLARFGEWPERGRGSEERHDILELPSEQVGRGGTVDLPPAVNCHDVLDCARMEREEHGGSACAEASEDLGARHELSPVSAGHASLQLRALLIRQ